MRFSLILPVFNGCEELKENFMPIYREVSKLGDCEIIIAEDGSTDCSKEVAKDFTKLKKVRLISGKDRSGKGMAIRKGIAAARGKTVGYMDIDLAVPVKYLGQAVRRVESGSTIVLGSRYRSGSNAQRSNYRLLESVGFNYLIKLLLGSKINDHQCGFKFWDGKYIKSAIKEVKDNYWFFDAEILVRAQRDGIVPYEMPVEWREGRKTKVKPGDAVYFFRAILRLRSQLGSES